MNKKRHHQPTDDIVVDHAFNGVECGHYKKELVVKYRGVTYEVIGLDRSFSANNKMVSFSAKMDAH